MVHINHHYLKLRAGYLFPEIARRVTAFAQANPQARIIRMGIGDVTEPLTPSITKAMHEAVDEMAQRPSFKGYGPEQGYGFLREAVAEHDFRHGGLKSQRMRSSSVMVQSAIPEIFWTSSAVTIELQSPIPCILFMWIPT